MPLNRMLRRLQDELGTSYALQARAVGIKPSTLSAIAHGRCPVRLVNGAFTPTAKKIAAYHGVSPLQLWPKTGTDPLSLTDPLVEPDGLLDDLDPLDEAIDADRRERALGSAMLSLRPQYRNALRRRFWMDQTLAEVGSAHARSCEQVRQWELRSLQALRKHKALAPWQTQEPQPKKKYPRFPARIPDPPPATTPPVRQLRPPSALALGLSPVLQPLLDAGLDPEILAPPPPPPPPPASLAVRYQIAAANVRLQQAMRRFPSSTTGPGGRPPQQRSEHLVLHRPHTLAEIRELERWWIMQITCIVKDCESILYMSCEGLRAAREFGISHGWHCAVRYTVCPKHLPFLQQIQEEVSKQP